MGTQHRFGRPKVSALWWQLAQHQGNRPTAMRRGEPPMSLYRVDEVLLEHRRRTHEVDRRWLTAGLPCVRRTGLRVARRHRLTLRLPTIRRVRMADDRGCA
jgi:hypothetical protein